MRHWKQARLSLTQRTEIWSRWKSGQSLKEIGRAFGKPSSCIHSLLVPRGGIAPSEPRSRILLPMLCTGPGNYGNVACGADLNLGRSRSGHLGAQGQGGRDPAAHRDKGVLGLSRWIRLRPDLSLTEQSRSRARGSGRIRELRSRSPGRRTGSLRTQGWERAERQGSDPESPAARREDLGIHLPHHVRCRLWLLAREERRARRPVSGGLGQRASAPGGLFCGVARAGLKLVLGS
jgi:hypothetical protein